MVVSDRISQVMTEKLASLKEKKVDQAAIFAWAAEVKDLIGQVPDVDTVSARREVLVPYMGREHQAGVQDLLRRVAVQATCCSEGDRHLQGRAAVIES